MQEDEKPHKPQVPERKYTDPVTTISFKLTEEEKNRVNRVLEARKKKGNETPEAGYRELFLGMMDFLCSNPHGYYTGK